MILAIDKSSKIKIIVNNAGIDQRFILVQVTAKIAITKNIKKWLKNA